jgi:subtilase family serine protease
MIRMRKTRLAVGIALGVATVMTPLAVLSGPASAATPNPNSPQQVASGVDVAALPGASVFGNTPASTPETVSFILREQNIGALESAAQRGISHYLSVSQFASIYGQPQANISALTGYLAQFGITTDVYADHVDVVANGTAGEFDAALSVTQKQYDVPAQAGRGGLSGVPAQDNVHGNVAAPLLPYRLAHFVLAVLGLSNYGPYANHATKATTSLLKPQAGSSNSCLATYGLSNGCHLPSFFSKTYNLTPLYAHGATGQGQGLAIVTLAALDLGSPEYFWSNIAHVTRTGSLTVDNVDGGPGAPSIASGTDETDLDVEESGAIAPGANVTVYQAPNTDYGFADAFFTAASQDTAGSVSASWGESETAVVASILSGQEAANYLATFDEAFLELAAQGQSAFTSSADGGAYTASEDIGTTNLSADVPADSPYITAAGATTLPWYGTLTGPDGTASVTVTAQRIWGWDYLWPAIAAISGEPLATAAESAVVGSGGGFSQLEPTPLYQQGVSGTDNYHAVQYLTPTDYTTVAPGLTEPTAWNFNPTPPVTAGGGNGRAIPDVSTDGDPQTGYLIYGASFAAIGDPPIEEYGGTSFVAPQLNAATAVINSFLGHRVGFWNPSIYPAAGSDHDPFTQLNQAGTSNDNIYYTGNPGELYNEGIGLGIPNLAKLASDFTR